MAIIQSILVGKGKGKIGNVVLSNLKGQTVAKQLNSSPSNPRTVAQTSNRVKMANAVLAWQFLANFMSNAKGLRKPLESIYNAFVRGIVKDMETVLESSRAIAGMHALALSAFSGNWFTIFISSMTQHTINVTFSTGGVAWLPTYRLAAIAFDRNTGEQVVVDIVLSETDFNNAGTIITMPGTVGGDVSAVYIYDSATSKITNIAGFEL